MDSTAQTVARSTESACSVENKDIKMNLIYYTEKKKNRKMIFFFIKNSYIKHYKNDVSINFDK